MTGDEAIIRTRRAYEASAAAWAGRGFDHFRIEPTVRRFAAMVEKSGSGRTVLDLGCGPGFHGGILRAHGLDVVGLDITMAMLRIARLRLGQPGTLVQGDARCLPLRHGSLAAVWAMASLLHLPKAQVGQALDGVNSVLTAGGVFASAMKEGDQDAFDGPRAGASVAAPRYFAHYRQPEWTKLLAAAGFVVEVQEINADSRPGFPDWITTFARRA